MAKRRITIHDQAVENLRKNPPGLLTCGECGLRFPLKVVEDAIQERIDSLAMSETCLDRLEKKVNEMMRENFAPAKAVFRRADFGELER